MEAAKKVLKVGILITILGGLCILFYLIGTLETSYNILQACNSVGGASIEIMGETRTISCHEVASR